MKPVVILATTLALAACADYDPGGRIDSHASRIDLADAAIGAQVPIPAVCNSACVMRLASPASCVRPGTRVGLHGITVLQGTSATRTMQELVYYNRLPPYLRDWWWNNARSSTRLVYLSGRQLIDMGAEACPG